MSSRWLSLLALTAAVGVYTGPESVALGQTSTSGSGSGTTADAISGSGSAAAGVAPGASPTGAAGTPAPGATATGETTTAGTTGAAAGTASGGNATASPRAGNTNTAGGATQTSIVPGPQGTPYFNDDFLQRLDPMIRRNQITPLARIQQAPVQTPTPADTSNTSGQQTENSLYGYRGAGATPPFFYDYYSYNPYYNSPAYSPAAAAATAAATPPMVSYFDYRDSNNDGFYDRAYSVRDADNDGVADEYELYAFNAMANQQQQQQSPGNQQPTAEERREAILDDPSRRGQGVSISGGLEPDKADPPRVRRLTVSGTIAAEKTATVNGREHRIAQVRSDGGQAYIVDLGPVETATQTLSPGVDVSVAGVIYNVGEQEVLAAERMTVNGREVTIDRRAAPKIGIVRDVSRVPVLDTEHTMAVVDIGGTQQLVDMGRRTAEELNLAPDMQIALHGVPVQVGEYSVLMAHEATVEGEAVPIER